MSKKQKKDQKTQAYKAKNTKKTISRILQYLSKEKSKLILSLILTFVSTGAMLGASNMLDPLLNNYITVKQPDLKGFAMTLLFMLALYFVSAGTLFIQGKIMNKLGQNTVKQMRLDLFNKVQDLPISFFDTNLTGDIMSRFTNDLSTISEALSYSFMSTLQNIVSFIGIIAVMLIRSPILALVTLTILPIMFLISKTIIKRSAKNFTDQQKALGELNGYLEESVEGLKVIKVFNREETSIEEFNRKSDILNDISTRAQFNSGVIMPLVMNLGNVNYAITAMVGGALSLLTNTFNIGTLAVFLTYSRQFSRPVTEISNQINLIQSAIAGAERMFEIIDQKVEVDNGTVELVRLDESTQPAKETDSDYGVWHWRRPTNNGFEYIPLKGDVRFNDVTFGYVNNQPVLKNLSLYAKPGQKIAFVGSTGAGKTTITNLINRFYDIDSGVITYDGIDIKDIKKADLRRSLGVVLQDTNLFEDTVNENIRYGNLNASDETVASAAKLSSAHSFIKRLPNGYNTPLSSNGANLSQGQRQLLSISRAAVADPPVLILDEATSSIDTRTERLIEIGMDRLMENRTVFVIAHRLSTVRNANAIIVLENGEIIERGDHETLLQQKGRYYDLYTGQFELS